MRNNGLLHSEPSEQATILNNQFQSAFSEKCNYTKQEFQNKCHMGGSYQNAPEINITCAGVLKLLQKLNPNKRQQDQTTSAKNSKRTGTRNSTNPDHNI